MPKTPQSVEVQGPDGKVYEFPAGTDQKAAIAYFRRKGIGGAKAPPSTPSTPDRFAQDRAITEKWAEGHPILGPAARFLVNAGQNAANAITQTPGAVYHAFADPATPEEVKKYGADEVTGAKRIGLGLGRIIGGDQAETALRDYGTGKVSPRAAVSVLPEALGTGVGQAMGGAAYAKLGQLPGEAWRAALPQRTALAEKIVSPLTYEGTGEALADLRQGQSGARGLVKEGLAGTKEGLVGKTGTEGKIGGKLGELKSRADQILQNHPNARAQINVTPDIDAAIDRAVAEEQKVGAPENIQRLENLRQALKTKFGNTTGTPYELNELKRGIQEAARGRGAYKNVVPVEGSTAKALQDTASRIRARVDQAVPEAAELNQRMSDLQDAQTPITKKMVQERGSMRMPGEGLGTQLWRGTVGSAPVRTGAARLLTFGERAPIPPAMGPLRPQLALPPGPTMLGSEMEPIGKPSAPSPTLPYQPSLQKPPAFVRPGEVRPAATEPMLYNPERAGEFRSGSFPQQRNLFATEVEHGPTDVHAPWEEAGYGAMLRGRLRDIAAPPEFRAAPESAVSPQGVSGYGELLKNRLREYGPPVKPSVGPSESQVDFNLRYPNEKFAGGLDPIARQAWQESVFGSKPVEDVLAKERATKKGVPRAGETEESE